MTPRDTDELVTTQKSQRVRTHSFDKNASTGNADEATKKGSRSPVKKEKKEKKEKKRKLEKSSSSKQKSQDDSSTAKKQKRRREEDESIENDAVSEAKKTRTDEESSTGYPLSKFNLSKQSSDALASRGIDSLFEIQAKTFPLIMAGRDVIGRAHTGCGKTLAFSLPVIEQLLQGGNIDSARGRIPKVLIMAPTRELAIQVCKEFSSTAPYLTALPVYGGSSVSEQARVLYKGVDAVVGTPGRICDHIERGNLKLGSVCHLILDEADQMLDMGFKDEMDKVFNAIKEDKMKSNDSKKLQTLLFSATMPTWVKDASKSKMSNPETVDLVGKGDKQASSDVEHLCLQCTWQQRGKTVSDLVRMYGNLKNRGRTIVFCETKKDCNELVVNKDLAQDAKVIHGDVAQAQRETTLKGFRDSRFPVLIATDVAARGLDIQGVDLVIQVQPPAGAFSGKADSETYIHRSGRTGRAGRKGICITLYKQQQQPLIKEIESATGNALRRIGAPQPSDMLIVEAKNVGERLQKYEAEVIDSFLEPAEKIVAEMNGDATRALAAALADITGFTDKKSLLSRSLLMCADGYTTVFYDSRGVSMHGVGLVFNALRREISSAAVEALRGVTLVQDTKGAVFDFNLDFKDDLDKILAMPQSQFSIISELPPLQEKKPAFSLGRDAGYGRGRGGFSGAKRGGRWRGSSSSRGGFRDGYRR